MRVLLRIIPVLVFIGIPSAVLAVGLPAGTTIRLVANADYTDAFNQPRSADPAVVTLTVIQVAGVAIQTDRTEASASPGQSVYIPVRIVNTGNGPDSMNLSVSSSRGWQTAIIYDTNADGVHQASEQWVITSTGTMIADGYCPCFVRVAVPADASEADTITLLARSAFNPAQATAATVFEVAPPSRSSTAITLLVTPHTPTALQQVTVSGSISPPAPFPLTLRITDPTGTVSSTSLNSAADGTFRSVFTPQRSGSYQVAVAFAGNGEYTASSTEMTVSVSKAASSISLIATPTEPTAGEDVSFNGVLTPAQQAAILISCTAPDGTTVQQQVTSGTQGTFTWTTRLNAAGSWQVRASYAGNAAYAPCSRQIAITVRDPQTPVHAVEITSGPTVSPATVVSSGSTQCSIEATDSLGHGLAYRWSDGGAGGTFTPSANTARPIYTARSNTTGRDIIVTLTCVVSCSQDPGVSAVGSTTLVVQPLASPPRVLSVSPADGAACVALDTPITIQFDRQMNRAATEQAIQIPPGLLLPIYEWSADSRTLTIRHQGLLGETQYTGVVGIGASDAAGTAMAQEFTWTFTTRHYLAFAPAEVSVYPDAAFVTPGIVLNDPTLPDTVTLFVGIPEDFTIDTAYRGTVLACVEPGEDTGLFFADWDPNAREIVITAVVANRTVGARIVKSITVHAPNANKCGRLLINGCPALTVRVGSAIPGDFNSDGAVNINDASLFVQQWSRWHRSPLPQFCPIADGPYDLAPKSPGTWPNWVPIGDGKININDASAFIECWIAARYAASGPTAQAASISAAASAGPSETIVRDEGDRLAVIVTHAPNDKFDAHVTIPQDARFDARTDASGNLAYVPRGEHAGTFFFTEFDEESRTVSISGTVIGRAPWNVAYIYIDK